VRDNPDVVDASRSLWLLLVADFWGTPATNLMSNKSWRPLTIGFYRAVRRATAEEGRSLSPRPYHGANVALHAAVSWQLAVLAQLLAGWAGHEAPASAAALAGLLFALHPVHVEAVAGLVGAAELLCALCYLLALRCYWRAARGGGLLRATSALAASLVLATAACLAKEIGFTAFAAFAGLDWLLLRETALRSPPRARLCALATRAAAVAATAAAYLLARDRVTGGRAVEVKTWRVQDNHLQFLPTRRARGLTVAHSHWRYARLLLSPHTLCADWNYACIPPVLDWRDARNAGAAMVYASCIAVALRARPFTGLRPLFLMRAPAAAEAAGEARSRPARLHLFLLVGLTLAPLAPSCNALVWVGAYLAERLLYLPSAGFALALGCWLAAGRGAARPLLASALLASYALRLHLRVPDWHSDGRLFTVDALTCPAGARVRFNAGLQARLAGDCEAGRAHQLASLAVLPRNNCGPHYELGTCAYNAGRGGEAADEFERALGCVDTAKNAGEALRMTLSELHSAFPDSPAVLMAHARVVPRLDPVDGPGQACAAAGRAAALLRAAGRRAEAEQAEKLCARGAAAARAAANESLAGLELARSCSAGAEEAAAAFVAAASAEGGRREAGVTPLAASAAATAFVRRWGPACRSHAGYAKAVNALQRADAYNPVLHMEWARLLRWGSLTEEAAAEAHAGFAARAYDELAAAGAASERAAAAAAAAAVRAEVAGWAKMKHAGPPSVTQLVDRPLTLKQLRALLPHMYPAAAAAAAAGRAGREARAGGEL